ncbi:hypothetical protein lerEdw1_016737, partial [Lerista edwardsae]
MAEDRAVVIVVDSGSDAEEISSLSEAGVQPFRGRSSSDIISVGSTEDTPCITSLRSSSGWTSLHVENVLILFFLANITDEVIHRKRNIKEICICCGSLEIHTQHPLFHGGMCAPCTEKFLERFFLCDADGAQADCAICCWSESLLMCDDPTCHRCFCKRCLDTLVGPGTANEVSETNPWICFLCVSLNVHGLLKRKTRWRAELKHFYDQESDHLWIYQPLHPNERKSIHVLSLFDDITQELKSFGFLGKSVGNGSLKYLENVSDIERKHIEELGPFDFIFGSTPPVGYKYPSGPQTTSRSIFLMMLSICPVFSPPPTPSLAKFFYQFYRILQYGRPPAMFWMFVDNLVLEEEIRDTASRFFNVSSKPPCFQENEGVLRLKQHNGKIQNAVHMWSNIPSVN